MVTSDPSGSPGTLCHLLLLSYSSLSCLPSKLSIIRCICCSFQSVSMHSQLIISALTPSHFQPIISPTINTRLNHQLRTDSPAHAHNDARPSPHIAARRLTPKFASGGCISTFSRYIKPITEDILIETKKTAMRITG